MAKGGEHLGILVPGASVTRIKGSGIYTNVTLCRFVCCDLFQLTEVSLILLHTSGHDSYYTRMACNYYTSISCALT
jgi:hypothetical protein